MVKQNSFYRYKSSGYDVIYWVAKIEGDVVDCIIYKNKGKIEYSLPEELHINDYMIVHSTYWGRGNKHMQRAIRVLYGK